MVHGKYKNKLRKGQSLHLTVPVQKAMTIIFGPRPWHQGAMIWRSVTQCIPTLIFYSVYMYLPIFPHWALPNGDSSLKSPQWSIVSQTRSVSTHLLLAHLNRDDPQLPYFSKSAKHKHKLDWIIHVFIVYLQCNLHSWHLILKRFKTRCPS